MSQFDSSLDVARSFHSDPDERTIYTERDEHMCGGVESGRKEKKSGRHLKILSTESSQNIESITMSNEPLGTLWSGEKSQ